MTDLNSVCARPQRGLNGLDGPIGLPADDERVSASLQGDQVTVKPGRPGAAILDQPFPVIRDRGTGGQRGSRASSPGGTAQFGAPGVRLDRAGIETIPWRHRQGDSGTRFVQRGKARHPAWPIPRRSLGRRVPRRAAEPAASPGQSPGPWRPRPRQRSSELRSRLELSGVSAWSFSRCGGAFHMMFPCEQEKGNARFDRGEGRGGVTICVTMSCRVAHAARR